MLTLADGSAAIGVGSSGSGPVPAALPPAGELSGTWHGSFWQLGGSLYANEGQSILEIKEDGTFTATVTPDPGANNLAKPSTRCTG